MGREWYNGGRSICFSKSKRISNEANGCITALCHFVPFHHFYPPSRHHNHKPRIHSPSRNPKGLVAPRNSLELTNESPLSTNYKDKESVKIPVGGIKSELRAILVDTSSDMRNLPSTKTPNVVARLMGLDLLPDNLDMNRSSSLGVRNQRLSENCSGTRSLPESPRISFSQKSDSDICRLSLQLNRENKHEVSRWKQDEESQNTRLNGRQVVKQLKEKVITRRFGMDITNFAENRKAGAAQNKIEFRKLRSRFSQNENTASTDPIFLFRQDQISKEPKQLSSSSTKVTLSKDSNENLKRLNKQQIRPINRWLKEDSKSKFTRPPTPTIRNKQRETLSSPSINSKSDCFNPLDKKKCIPKSNDIFNISVASSAVSATERPRKQMKRAEEPERNTHATICSGKMYKYEEKLPQEPRSSYFSDSTAISATVVSTKIDFKHLPGMKKLEEEEENVVTEIARHIVDALVLETVKATSFEYFNVAFW